MADRRPAAAAGSRGAAAPKKYGDRRYRGKHPREGAAAAAASVPDDETYEEEWADEWAGEDWAEDDDEESEIPPSSAEFRRTRGDRKKWRGGPCPAPPPLEARFQNIYKQPRYYQKWVRKVHMWKARARHYKPMAELALDLSDVITGEGAEMIESLEWTRLYSQDGIDLVINSLAVFDEQQILQVGDLMEEYEEVERLPGELLAAYVAHFKDLEMRLKRAELPAQQGQFRAFKLLRSSCLSPEVRRNLLLATGNEYDFDRLVQAMSYDGWHVRDSVRRPLLNAGRLVEIPTKEAAKDEIDSHRADILPEDEAEENEDEDDPDQAEVNEACAEEVDSIQVMQEVADALTVTSDKLKKLTLGRGWTGSAARQAAADIVSTATERHCDAAGRHVFFRKHSWNIYGRPIRRFKSTGGISEARVSPDVFEDRLQVTHLSPDELQQRVAAFKSRVATSDKGLDTLRERAHFTKINLYDVPLKIAPNGHLLLRVDSWLKDVGFPREPEAWKFTPSDVIIPEPQWIPEEARSSRRTVQLTRQNLAINAWTNLMQLIMNHLSHIIGRSREQFRQNMEMSNRMMGAIAQMGHEMGYLTPMADSVKAIARGAAQVPESVLPPPPAPEDQAQNYSQLCEKRDVCAHPATRRYYAKGYWLICDQCGRRWKSVNGKWIVMVKRGAWKRLLGIAKKTTAACETLINVSQDADRRAADLRDAEWCCSDVAFMDIPVPELPDHRYLDNECQACGTDLIEGCAGTARPTRLASRFELRASPSADIEDGWDLSTTRGAQRWKDQILKDKPLYVIVGFPCTLWCSYNVNVNYVDHPELLERLRARDRRLIDLIKWTIKYQVKHGRFFLFENPPTSAIWKDLQFAPLLPLGETVIGHGCQYGKTGKTGLPIRKAYRWFSNSPPVLAALSRRCPGLRPESGGHLHDPIENSKWTKASGEYTDEMAHAMLYAIQQVAAQRNPSRFADMPVAATEWEVAYNHAGPIEVLFASPEKDPTRWEAVMQGVRQIVGGSASRGGNKAMHYLSKSSALWRQISQLVPWDLTMIQLAKAAKQRRFPINKEPWSHRGHCYVDEKGHYHIEAEDLVDVAFPTLALSPPADLAVFSFGYAKQESLPQEPDTSQIEKRMPLPPDPNDPMLPNNSLPPDEDDDLQDVPIARMPDASGGMAGIRFVGVTKEQCPREVRQLVARMHCNLGHPVPSEFFQFLAQRGASQATLLCARALRCPACLRRKRPQRQRESQIPRVGLFNDLVKGDLFYVMTHDGDVWEKFQTCWLTPFGIMQILVVDRDGAFEAVFMDNCHTLGIDVRYVPPGAHWQLGLAESGNYAWRRVFEKVIDVILPTMPEHVDLAIISTSHAVNQSVRRAGRAAYAAAFGRVPTLPTELLADTTSAEFWHNCTQDEMLAYGERCRIEALKAIADLEADEALRTSILRQPVNRKEYDFLSGQRAAAWGEHGRKRRGKTPVAGYRPGIFCFWDSGTNGYGEGESAWLRIGHRTVQVAREHIRPAVGFEGWTPSEEDLKELKTAEQDLAKARAVPGVEPRVEPKAKLQSPLRPFRGRHRLSLDQSEHESALRRKLPHIPGSPSPAAFVSNESDEMEFITPDGWDGVEEPVLLRTRVFSSLAEVQEAYEAHLLPIENFENDPIDDSEPDDDWTNCLCMTYHELSDLRDGEMDVDCATAQVGDTTDSNNLSRREQRQLDREIPWREIAEYPEDQFMEYECQNWDTWKSVRACSQEEAEQVRRDPHLRKRCIRSRVCYRDKNLGFPPLKAKARPVLLGFSDPDLEKLPRNAPVLTDAGKKLICQIAVSNDWRVGTGDAESAFLQGGAQSEREEAIYMIPPKDPIVQAAGVFTAPLYEVVGNLYGQSTAPYLWYKHVVTTFLALGSKLHSLDSALFLFDFTPIEKAIKWRGWQWDNFVFLGEEYQRLRQGPYSGSLFVHQAAYTKAIAVTKVGVMSSTRSSSKLTRSEREDLESAVGSLQWLSGHTRPDLSAAVSLVQRTDPELNDLRMAMKHVEYAHRTAQTGILIVRVDLSRACFVSFADSSWANAPGLKTQIGTLIFLADEVILTGPTSCTLLFHKSKRTPRVVRSTLAGEAIAQDLGVDYASYLSKFLSEMLTGRPAGRHPPIFEVITVTDCKSLCDALHQLTPSLSEKRTVIDVISIRDEVKVKNVRWIPTTHMIADGMTKFLADPVLSLVESIACEELTGRETAALPLRTARANRVGRQGRQGHRRVVEMAPTAAEQRQPGRFAGWPPLAGPLRERTNSRVYVPLLLAAAGLLDQQEAAGWSAHPLTHDWWQPTVEALQQADAVPAETFAQGLEFAGASPGAIYAVIAAGGGARPGHVHLPPVARALADSAGYIDNLAQEQLLERFTRFEAGDWAQLLTEAQPGPPRRPPERDANGQSRAPEARRGRAPDENEELRSRCGRARELIRLGEVSAARQALTASAVAPGTQATLDELRDPARRLQQPREQLSERAARAPPQGLASLEPDRLLTNVRRSRRGAAPGPSGMTGEHLQTLLDDEHCCDLLHHAATLLARAQIPGPVAEALRLGRLTALRKSNGRVRGIVTGDVFRRLVARTLAQQVGEEVEQATAPFQFALSTRAGTECVAHLVQTLTQGDPAATVVSIDGIVWNRGGQEPLGIRELGSAADRVWVGGADTPPEAQGLVVLGAPIGHGAFVAQHLEAILEEHRRLLARIPHVGDLQSSWLLLSMCANPRANFFLRALAPEDTAAFAAAHDDNLANALADLLELPQEAVAEGTSARQRCQLPLCMGGLGLRSASRTAPAAWWASWADCAQMLRERCPELTNQICAALSELDRGPLPAAPGCLQQASRAKEHLSAHGFAAPNWHDLAQGARPPPTHEREHGEWAHGWQFWAARVLENTARQQLLNASTPPDRALLRSQSGPCAGRAFTALPTTGDFHIPPAEFRVLLLRRLRFDLPFAASACRCRGRLDARGDHRAACPRAGVLKKRSIPLEKAAARICREAGGRVAENQLLRDLNVDGVDPRDGRKIEVIANCLPLWGGAQLAIDATLVSPVRTDGTAQPRAADEDGVQLEVARGRKEATYPELIGSRRCRLVVLGLEVGGRWSEEALTFVRLLARTRARSAPQRLRASARAAYLHRWTGLAAVAAQRAFAATLLELPPHTLAVDGDEPHLADLLADARYTETP
ncbi:unnamed protein product, partial [Prorocentrum cordatum]